MDKNAIYLKDYRESDFLIDTVDLSFDLDETNTLVQSKMSIRKNPKYPNASKLVLVGEDMELVSVKIDGEDYSSSKIIKTDKDLTIEVDLDKFQLEIENRVNPKDNKALEGLYISGHIFCTQCEAEGFRRITYYLDRPDIMAVFSTKIIADKEKYPILLSNGNLIEKGDLENGRHFAIWEDPFKKPSYLYALVAGELGMISDEFVTMRGKNVKLEIYCDKGNESKCTYAMEALKNSMSWDEETYGLEYDLSTYMIVAVDSFNMGAMENKGLNIFNSSCVLVDEKTATDNDFLRVEGVIGHEYFHNWTGNRITCRDWFQLTLKEGLTVFRDQEFSSDQNSRPVKRIDDVSILRNHQYPEDAGPNSHPIKPDHFVKIDNFYTATIYDKGAEVIRMIHTILGETGFRKGMDKYFELFDGMAVTTEDFIYAMSIANNGYNFDQFKNWYSQAGTPRLKVSYDQDLDKKELKIKFEQVIPKRDGQKTHDPFHMPIKLGFVGNKKLDFNLELSDNSKQTQLSSGIVHLKQSIEEFTFTGIDEIIVPSINREYSAPVFIDVEFTDNDFAHLMAKDSDSFNRYEAAQQYGKKVLTNLVKSYQNGESPSLPPSYLKSYESILNDDSIDFAYKSDLLMMPASNEVFQLFDIIDFENIDRANTFMHEEIGSKFYNTFEAIYNEMNIKEEFKVDNISVGRRKLKNTALKFLVMSKNADALKMCFTQFVSATNMNDEISAFTFLHRYQNDYIESARESFYNKWKHEPLVLQKWIRTISSSSLPGTLEKLEEIESLPEYDETIPNFARALIHVFGAHNYTLFNNSDGSGYKYMGEKIVKYDKINPQLASRLARVFTYFEKLPVIQKDSARLAMENILKFDISANTREIVENYLA